MLGRLLFLLAFALTALLQPVAAFAMPPCGTAAGVAAGCAAPGDCSEGGSKPSQQVCMTICATPCPTAAATLPLDVGVIAPQREGLAPSVGWSSLHSRDPGRIDRPPKT